MALITALKNKTKQKYTNTHNGHFFLYDKCDIMLQMQILFVAKGVLVTQLIETVYTRRVWKKRVYSVLGITLTDLDRFAIFWHEPS